MFHRDLIDAMASDLGSKERARAACNAFVRAMWYGLVQDGIVTVRDLGTFEVRALPARRVRQVTKSGARGEEVAVAPAKLTAFRMAKALKIQLRDTPGGG